MTGQLQLPHVDCAAHRLLQQASRQCLQNENSRSIPSCRIQSFTTPRCDGPLLHAYCTQTSLLTCALQTLSNLYSLTSSLFGVTAGILGLESYTGFLLYLLLSILTTALVYGLKVAPESRLEGRPVFDTQRFFKGAGQFWAGGLMSGLSGFVLTWTLFYGLVRV